IISNIFWLSDRSPSKPASTREAQLAIELGCISQHKAIYVDNSLLALSCCHRLRCHRVVDFSPECWKEGCILGGKDVGADPSFTCLCVDSDVMIHSRSKFKGANMSSTGRGATLAVLVERHPVRKHNHLNSFSDMSASYADVGGMLDEKAEKPQTLYRPFSCDGLVSKGVSGTPVDHHDGPYSPAPSSGVSSASNISELSPATPAAAVTRPNSSCIEISSVRYLRGGQRADVLDILEPAYDGSSRHTSDASPV
ncbi:hypothetical protein FPV67DRAFT_295498, partial [Lyophyllum atratum]